MTYICSNPPVEPPEGEDWEREIQAEMSHAVLLCVYKFAAIRWDGG